MKQAERSDGREHRVSTESAASTQPRKPTSTSSDSAVATITASIERRPCFSQ